MVDEADPTLTNPKYDATLTDGVTTLGFMLYDSTQKRNKTAVRRFQTEPPLRIQSDASEYADRKEPYTRITQNDFSGGLGIEDHNDDATRYVISHGITTYIKGKIFLSGQTTYPMTGQPLRTQVNNFPNWDEDVEWLPMYETSQTYLYRAHQFTMGEAFTANYVEIYLRKVGTPGTLQVAIYSDNAGSPGTLLDSNTYSGSATLDSDVVIKKFTSITPALADATPYWLVVRGGSGDDATDHWKVGGKSTGSIKKSNDGSAWSTSTGMPFYRICKWTVDSKFCFELYNKALYVASSPWNGGAGKLYLNGFRGACDPGASNLLQDAYQGFEPIIGKSVVAMLSSGKTRIIEEQDWRNAVGTSGTALTVSPNWNATLVTKDEYVIAGTDWWKYIDGSAHYTTPIQQLLAGNNYLIVKPKTAYIGDPICAYNVFNNGGTWDDDNWSEWNFGGDFLVLRNDPVLGNLLYAGINSRSGGNEPNFVNRGLLPYAYNDNDLWLVELTDGEYAWNEQVVQYVTTTFDDTEQAVKIVVGADFTTGVIASKYTYGKNATMCNIAGFYIKPNQDLNAGDLELLLDDSALCASPVLALVLPSLKKDQYNRVQIFWDGTNLADMDQIFSVGLQLTTDLTNELTLYIQGPVWLYRSYHGEPVGTANGDITGMQLYDDPQQVFVFTEDGLGFMQNEKYVPIQTEIDAVTSNVNGRAHCVSDVYLVFNMVGCRVERYYRNNIEDISPIRDDGLPQDMLGEISSLERYPGKRIIATIDGGSSNYSSIMMYQDGGWHVLYKAPYKGARIYNCYVQSIQGVENPDRLWFSMGAEVCSIPICFNPLKDPSYTYCPYGELITSWYDAGRKDLDKVFESIKIYSENVGSDCEIHIDYQLNNDTAWTYAGEIETSPADDLALSSGLTEIKGKRIRLRLRLYTFDRTTTPIINSVVIDCYMVGNVTYGYQFTTSLGELERPRDIDYETTKVLGVYDNVEDAQAKLDEWAENMTRLRFSTIYSPMEDKIVYMPPFGFQPVKVDPEEQQEEHFVSITLREF